MKRVLIISTEYYDYFQAVEDAFQDLGWETKVEVYYYQVMSLRERLVYNFSKLFYRDEAFRILFNKRALKSYARFEPDLVFVFQAVPLYAASMKTLSQSRAVLWILESIFEKEHIYAIREYFDSLFLYIKSDLPRLFNEDNTEAYFLPCAVNEKVYFPMPKSEEVDISFVGNLDIDRIQSERAMLLLEVVKRFQDLNIKIYGVLSPDLEKRFAEEFPSYRDYFQNRTISPQEVSALYSKSKICINIHSSGRAEGTNQRFFEVLGTKSFQIVNENDFINENFTEREVVTYRDREDLLNKISYYLENKQERMEIAENGYKKVIEEHTFRSRVSKVVEVIQDTKDSN